MTQFSGHVSWKFILQLITGISGGLQHLLKYFNDTTISILFVLLSARVLPVILALTSTI